MMEPREMFDQITAEYGHPTPAALLHDVSQFSVRYEYVLLARPAKARR